MTSISLCMIVRDEEANLRPCLANVADLVDEIIVVDTGSTDGTKALAAELGAKVYDFAWVDDFSAARNETLRHATGRWIFWLDADDRVDRDNVEKLRELFTLIRTNDSVQPAAFTMECCSTDPGAAMAGASTTHVRLFRTDAGIHWRGRVHESPAAPVDQPPLALCPTNVMILHLGYNDPGLLHSKAKRDLRLLQIAYATSSERGDLAFYLGRARLALNEPGRALPLLQRGVREADTCDACRRKAYALLVDCLHRLGRRAEALEACELGLKRFPEDTELIFSQGILLCLAGQLADAEACFLRLLNGPDNAHMQCGVLLGLRGARSRYMLGIICAQTGRMEQAERYYRQALAEQPAYTDAWAALGQICLAGGREAEAEAILDNLATCPRSEAPVCALRGQLYTIQRHYGPARRLLRRAVSLRPDVLWMRLALADLLFVEGADWDQCIQVHREILQACPQHQPIRQRLEFMTRQRQGDNRRAAASLVENFPSGKEISPWSKEPSTAKPNGPGVYVC